MTLTLVTDCHRACPEARTDRDLVTTAVRWLSEAIDDEIDVIQIREHRVSAATLLELAKAVVQESRGTATRVLINDRADVALVAGADGVHLRDHGGDPRRVRALRDTWVVGRSIHEPAADAEAQTALDYVHFGAVFPSGDKPGVGCARLREVTAASRIPVTAVGGITPSRVGACLEAGATGVAAISIFLPVGTAPTALGPARAIAELRAAGAFPYTVRNSGSTPS